MRPLEVVLLVAVLLAGAWLVGARRGARADAALVAVVLLAAAGAQTLLEGVRWQLVPLQAAAAIAIVLAGVALVRARPLPAQRSLGGLGVVLALATAALAWALPVPLTPGPDPAAAVGTVTIAITDEARPERFGPTPGRPREIAVQLWYPADPDIPGEPAPLVSDARLFGRAAAAEIGLPRFALDHIGMLRSGAVPGAPLDPNGPTERPLVLYSHSWKSFRAAQAGLFESLASHGYVVAAVDHTFASLVSVFPDDRRLALDPLMLPDNGDRSEQETAKQRLLGTFAEDLELVLDHLAGGDVEPIRDGFDLDRVALVGHGTGGGAAVLACTVIDRCGVVVTFDPWIDPLPDEVVGAGIDVPLLSVRTEEWADGPYDPRLRRLHAANEAPEGRVEIHGTLHGDFTFVPLLSPIAAQLGLSGPTPGATTHEIVQDWTRRFLDHHLLGRGSDPLRVPPAHPESRLEKAAE